MTAFNAQNSPLARLQDWYRSPLGQTVARVECVSVERLLCQTFGYYLIQIGAVETFADALTASRIRHRVLIPGLPTSGQHAPQILSDAHQLPFAADSVDAILLPHTLDVVADSRAVLSEVERVLIPDGRVIIVGFNALSAWGLWGWMGRTTGRAPWRGQFYTAGQIERWLSDFGFESEVCEHIMFCPPIHCAPSGRCASVESWGQRFLPALGGIYVIRAIKRVTTLTPLKPSWLGRRRIILTDGAMRPTRRGTEHV